jgi:hypothetical protein
MFGEPICFTAYDTFQYQVCMKNPVRCEKNSTFIYVGLFLMKERKFTLAAFL